MNKAKIEIGAIAGKNTPVYLDVPKLFLTRMLVQAASGQGKSHWLRRLVEELSKLGIQVFVIDHEGEFATLRKHFDFFLAGEGGDLPIDVRTASVTARRFLELRQSCVFDLSDTFRSTPSARHTWVKNFIGDGMMEAPKSLWTPVVVVVDEAHKYMPEKSESEALEAMTALATDGRKREFCAIYATQRLSKLNKDGAAELLNKFIGGTSLGLDRKRAAEELGIFEGLNSFHKEIMSLDRGLFYALGPAIAKDRVLVHVGETVTAPPARGARAAAPPPAPTKVKAMLQELGDLAKVAEKKLETEKQFRARISELEKELKIAQRSAPKATPAPSTTTVVKAKISEADLSEALKPIVDDHTTAIAQWIEDCKKHIETQMQRALASAPKPVVLKWRPALTKAAAMLNKSAGSAAPAETKTSNTGTGVTGANGHSRISPSIPNHLPAPATVDVQANGDVTKPMMRILKALVEIEGIGQPTPTREQVAFWSESSPTSSSFEKNVSGLKSSGRLTIPGPGLLQATDDGRVEIKQCDDLTADQVFARGLQLLTAPQRRLIEALHASYPSPLTRADLAQAANAAHSSSSFEKNLSGLKTAGLVTYPSKGEAKAADWLFF